MCAETTLSFLFHPHIILNKLFNPNIHIIRSRRRPDRPRTHSSLYISVYHVVLGVVCAALPSGPASHTQRRWASDADSNARTN